jgi:hypothetical protein
MDLWDRDSIDLVGPAFIEFSADGHGAFRLIAVEGLIDARQVYLDGHAAVEFSWDGFDDGDRVSGRGWARLEADGSLRGHLFIHCGDDSGFRAIAAEVSE